VLVKEQKLLTLPEFMPVFSGIRFVQSLVFCVMLCGSLFVLCSVGPCIVPVLLTAFVWSLYCLCTTYGFRLVILLYLYYIRFRLVILLSLYYLQLSFGHCIVSVLLTALVWSLYCLCTTYGFRLVIVLSLYYLGFLITQLKSSIFSNNHLRINGHIETEHYVIHS
jgi:hypothetical protein